MDKILIVDPPPGTPPEFLEDGELFLELSPSFSFELTENAAELNDVNKLKGSGVLGFSVQTTTKNLFIFERFIHPQSRDNTAEPYEVVCIGNGFKVLPQNRLYFRGYQDAGPGSFGSIDLEVVEEDDFWIKKAQELFLNEIDLGEFEITREGIIADWQNNDGLYSTAQENTSLWTPVDYGVFQRPQDDFYGVLIEDLRPLVSLSAVLQQGFKQIGYKLQSPLLENDEWFNRLWCYLLGTEFTYDGQGAGWTAAAEITGTPKFFAPAQGGAQSNPLFFDSITNDPSGGLNEVQIGTPPNVGLTFDTTTFSYLRPGNSDYRVTFDFQVRGTSTANFSIAFDAALYSYPAQERLDVKPDLVIEPGEEPEFTVEFEFNIEFGQRVYLALEALHPIDQSAVFITYVEVLPGSTATFTPIGNQFYEGDLVPVGQLLNPEYTLMDLIKGTLHLVKGYIYEDAPRDLWIYPREETLIYDEVVEGYFRGMDNVVDLTQYTNRGTEEVAFQDTDSARYIRIRFAESSDGFIEKNGLENDGPLFSHLEDLERGDIKETVEYENPFFEPTANTQFYNKEVPAMWDSKEPVSPAVEIGPRILYCEGYKFLRTGLGPITAEELSGWVFENTELTRIIYIGQTLKNFRVQTQTGFAVQVEKCIAYGDPTLRNLYDQFWKYFATSIKYNRTFAYEAELPFDVYDNLDFRSRVLVYYRGRMTVGELLSKEGYEIGGSQKVKLLIKPNAAF